MLWSSSMRDIRNAALIAVETKRAGHPDRELLNRIVVFPSLTVILRSSWSENLEKREKEVIGKTFINLVRIEIRRHPSTGRTQDFKPSFRFYALGGCWIDKIVD